MTTKVFTKIEKINLKHMRISNMSVSDATVLKICDYYVQYINQLVNQEFINQSINLSINKSINQSINRSINQ